jgi:polyamine oxidase
MRFILASTVALLYSISVIARSIPPRSNNTSSNGNGPRVLILGGGIAGVIAARTLHDQGIDNFTIIEAGSELGGRMKTHTFGTTGREWTVEVGANWIQGAKVGNGTEVRCI